MEAQSTMTNSHAHSSIKLIMSLPLDSGPCQAVNKLGHTTTCKGAHCVPHNHIHTQGWALIGSLATTECCKLVSISIVTHACMWMHAMHLIV